MDIELAVYLTNVSGPVTLVLDFRIGSTSDPSINGHLRYPNDLDRPLHEDAADKIRLYHTDHNNRPSNTISFKFMSVTSSTLVVYISNL